MIENYNIFFRNEILNDVMSIVGKQMCGFLLNIYEFNIYDCWF